MIDLGTNNIQLLIVEKEENIRVLEWRTDVTAFGKNMQDDLATEEALASLQFFIKKYLEISQTFTEDVIIIGTSGARTARNIKVIQDWLRETYQLPLHIISGEEEAFLNGLANRNDFKQFENVILFDIGGGSTEFTFIQNGNIDAVHSLDLGIRYLENRFQDNVSAKKDFVQNQLQRLKVPEADFMAVGIGKTAASLEKLITFYFALEEPLQSSLEKTKIDVFFTFLDSAAKEEIQSKMNFDDEQTAIIHTGTMLTKEILTFFGKDCMLISDKGLQFGILQLLQDELIESPVFFKNYLRKAMQGCKMHMLKKEDFVPKD